MFDIGQINILSVEAIYRAFTTYMPNIIGTLIILAVGWVIGRVLGSIIGRIVSRTGADMSFRRASVGRAILRAGYTASDFSRTVTKWIIYLITILLALQNLSVPVISTTIQNFLNYLPNVIIAFIIFIAGSILSDWAGESIKKSFTAESNQEQYLNLFGEGVKIILYFVTITIALSQLGIDITIIYIIATAFSWSIAIAVGVATGIVLGWVLKDRVREWLQQGRREETR
ncbi:MAG TPA: hypothetical protein EYH45_05205 [Candidatus Caldiarchaeum subterraneum]|uniref:Uncharacterized protein n=1 Tax=Caldiarchaeum subterraneum TaxID=311458 RepID=A0A833EC55_CALS0|nr:hypothetical protein [Candidatus Caldarchaeum subterraneum]